MHRQANLFIVFIYCDFSHVAGVSVAPVPQGMRRDILGDNVLGHLQDGQRLRSRPMRTWYVHTLLFSTQGYKVGHAPPNP